MNILLIGNGFDLAHGLPTRYTDFLDFTESFLECYKKVKNNEIDWSYWDVNNELNKYLKEIFCINKYKKNENSQTDDKKKTIQNLIEELKECIEDNVWVKYFLWCRCNNDLKENWIDFESEICKIIKAIEKDMSKAGGITTIVREISDCFFSDYFLEDLDKKIQERREKVLESCQGLPSKKEITYKNLIGRLENDLIKLIRALEIYICEYVEKIDIKVTSPDIDELEIDFILSFNYTHIFSKLYNISDISKKDVADSIDYIHGEANSTIETNNMVLGIDEYLPKKRRNKEVEFIAFKKFYQRIYKQTGCKYKEWVEKIKNSYVEYQDKVSMYQMDFPQHNLYIFGHSLDVTDKDILRDLILNDNVYTTIFYYNKAVMGQQIANLVKVIGQDELIKRTGGNTKTIEFKQQQNMIPITKEVSEE